MTISEYISTKLAKFGVEFSTAELEAELMGLDFDGTIIMEGSAEVYIAKAALVKFIPELLLKPDITEGGYSIKQNTDGIKAFLQLLCDELGLENPLDRQPRVSDASDLW